MSHLCKVCLYVGGIRVNPVKGLRCNVKSSSLVDSVRKKVERKREEIKR